jgi:hypothetical protein
VSIDIKALNRLLDEIQPTVQKGNDTDLSKDAPDIRSPEDELAQPYGHQFDFMSKGDSLYLQSRLNSLNWQEKGYLFQRQLEAGMGKGVPIGEWNANWGKDGSAIQKALDTTGGSALIRQDLSPFLISMFIQYFPAWQRIEKVPANGLTHAWDQLTAYASDTTTSSFISELGTVVDKTGQYTRATTNIAVYGQRRGVSFKQQLAVGAGGMSWDSARLEIQNGLTQLAHDLQKTIFQGNASNSGGTAVDELGAYDANAFTGLRALLNSATTTATTSVNFAPYLTSAPDNFVTAFNSGITNVANNVGVSPTVVYARMNEVGQLSNQQISIQRTVDRTEFIPGVRVPAVMTAGGEMPVLGVPGDAIGTYTSTADSSRTVADMYMVNEQFLQLPYLGDPGPSVIEIPPGVSGQLTRLYIVWGMWGLALLSNLHSVKIRTETRTS